MKHTFSYIVEFKGGTYCSQVTAKNLKESVQSWLGKIIEQKSEIMLLDDGIIAEIADIIKDSDYHPVQLEGLQSIWYMHVPTTKGALHVNIVKTDLS